MPKQRSLKTRASKRHSVERKHAVKAELRVHGLSKAGTSLNLEIYASRLKIGDMTVGQGSLYWYGRHRHTRKRISWTRFADMMDRLAYGR